MARKGNLLFKNVFYASVSTLLLLHADGSWAEAGQGTPATQGVIQGENAKIVFDWPQSGNFTVSVNDRTLTVMFDRNVSPDFGALLGQLYPYIIGAQRKADGKTIVFTMDQPYRIRTFKSDRTSGVILLNIDPTRQRSYKKQKTAPVSRPAPMPDVEEVRANQLNGANPSAGKVEEEQAQSKQTAKKQPDPLPAIRSEDADSKQRSVQPEAQQPLAGEKKASPQTFAVAEAKKASDIPLKAAKEAEEDKKGAPEVKKEVVETKEPEPRKPVSEAAAGQEKKTEQAVTEQAADKPEEPTRTEAKETAQPAPKSDGKLKVIVSASDDSATLRFPFTERTASAVFIRSGVLWVVFDKTIAIDLSDFDALPKTVLGKAEILPDQKVTIMRMPVSSVAVPTIAKEAGKYEWTVILRPDGRLLSNALEIQVKTDPPAPPHVFIPALEMADSVEFTDPQVGDTLVVTPLFSIGEGVFKRRDFIEFSLLETAQGIVVTKKSEEIDVVQLRNGLRISPHQGITLTPGLPPVKDADKPQALQSTRTLFPYEDWRVPEKRHRSLFMADLQRSIVEAESIDEENRSRVRMAQLFLSEGLAPEAIAQLESIARKDIVFYRSAKLSALRGLANFLMARYAEASRDFSVAELNNNMEIDYWRNMLADLLGNPGKPYNYLDLNTDYISKYPPILRQRLAIVAADRSVEKKEYNIALKIFDSIKAKELIEPIQDYVNYLLAVISAATGQEDDAIAMWDKLAENHKSPFVQARAEFSRILWGMEQGDIDREEAIDRLERLRLRWHGDNMELKVLTLLGNMYADRKDYVNAMRVWNGAITSFPNTAVAVEMERKMEDAFVNLFDDGAADVMPPLDILTLYYQYRDHLPGGNVGSQIVSKLADKLLAVDLLNEAAALVNRQMREREKEERSQLGAKLATIHLLNNDSQKALIALQDSVYGDISQPLTLWRNRLLAEALYKQGRDDKALQILKNDSSTDAEQIRMSIFWQRRDWPMVIRSAEAVLKARKKVSEPLTIDEGDAVLKLALAYIFEDNKIQLQYLRDYFDPLMANNPYKPVFEFVTAKDIELTPTNFDEVMQSMSNTRSFLAGYRARIQTAGLDSVMGTRNQ